KAGLVGGMLQTGALIRGLSVRELVSMVASLYPSPLDIGEVLELAGLTDAAQQRTEKLSGGQTQRARFAVAVVSNPELLILDEPAAIAGVNSAERHGDAVILVCADSDQAIREVLARYPAARDIEITGAGLEDAFVRLTGEPDDELSAAGAETSSAR